MAANYATACHNPLYVRTSKRKDDEPVVLIDKINHAIAFVSMAEEALGDEDANVDSSTRRARQRIHEVGDEANGLVAQMMAFLDAGRTTA